jgi:integrase
MAYYQKAESDTKSDTYGEEYDMRCLYTLYKKSTQKGIVWYARFWNEKTKKYAVARSTEIFAEGKKERRREAELKAQEMLSGIRFETDAGDSLFISYLEGFWKPNSPYVREQATLRKNPLSVYYVKQNAVNIKHHIKPYPKFNKLSLRELTAGMIKDWMAWIADKDVSGRTINQCLSTMRVPVNYAYDREELERNPFRKIKQATETPQEKGVLTFAERAELLASKTTDPHSRLAVLLGLLCGLRRGEVRGLKWGDFGNGLIKVQHNYIDHEGLKKPKRGKIRTVPYPSIVEKAFDEVCEITLRKASDGTPLADDFVFDSYKRPGVPMGESFFRNAIRRELEEIGISAGNKDDPNVPNEQQERNLSFHSLRHSFITLGRLDGISDLEIQAMAGHSTRRMMEHYSHAEKVIDFMAMRERLDKAVEVRAAK